MSPETDLALVRQGDHVALKLNAFPTETFDGVVDRVGARIGGQWKASSFLWCARYFENSRGWQRTGWPGGLEFFPPADGLERGGFRWAMRCCVLRRAGFGREFGIWLP